MELKIWMKWMWLWVYCGIDFLFKSIVVCYYCYLDHPSLNKTFNYIAIGSHNCPNPKGRSDIISNHFDEIYFFSTMHSYILHNEQECVFPINCDIYLVLHHLHSAESIFRCILKSKNSFLLNKIIQHVISVWRLSSLNATWLFMSVCALTLLPSLENFFTESARPCWNFRSTFSYSEIQREKGKLWMICCFGVFLAACVGKYVVFEEMCENVRECLYVCMWVRVCLNVCTWIYKPHTQGHKCV